MKSKKINHYKIPNSYNNPNKRVVWPLSNENTSVSTSRELLSNTSMAVDSPSVNLSLTSEYMNSLNRETSEVLTMLSLSLKFLPSHKTPTATQPAEVNMSSVGQPAGINVPIPHGQDMDESTEPMIEPLAILYNNN